MMLENLNQPKRHDIGNKRCYHCEDYWCSDIEFYFPLRCVCGGLIHMDSWGYSDEYECFAYYHLQCEKCGTTAYYDFPSGWEDSNFEEVFIKMLKKAKEKL